MAKNETKDAQAAATARNLPVSRLRASTWNTHAEEQETESSLSELKETISKNGIIQRLTVRPIGNGDEFEIVDGHRRFRAAQELGLDVVPCEVKLLTDAEAQTQTLVANIQRLANDPLLEAGLITRMTDDGKSFDDIAATIGKSKEYVIRRSRLVALTEKWRVAAKERKLGIAALEEVARHDPELQDKVLDSLCEWEEWTAQTILAAFKRKMRLLSGAPFSKDKCAKCPHNTATSQFLFPDMKGGDAMCENADCFVSSWNRCIDKEIESLRRKGIEVFEAKTRYDIPDWGCATERKSKTNTVPYVVKDGDLRRILWSATKVEEIKAPALTAEERAQVKAQAKAEKHAKTVLRNAREKVREYLRDDERRGVLMAEGVNGAKFASLAWDMLKERVECPWIDDGLVDRIARLYRDRVEFGFDQEERGAFGEDSDNTSGEEV